MSDWIQDNIGWMFIVAVIVGSVAFIVFAIRSEHEWQDQARAAHCVQTGQLRTIWTTVAQTVGKDVVMTPMARTEYEYRCDDGIVWH